jgi:hypothetical protein
MSDAPIPVGDCGTDTPNVDAWSTIPLDGGWQMAKHSPEHERNRSRGSGHGSGQQSGGQQEEHQQQQQQGPDRDRATGGSGGTERKRSGSDDMTDRGQQHRDDVERE